jgi:nucleotide-binding universal stress UspA family protein
MAQAFSRILLAYDDSVSSQMALRYACALAQAGGKLSVAYACNQNNFAASAVTAGFFPATDPTAMIAAADDEHDAILGAAFDACAAHGVSAEKIIVHEADVDGIHSAARQTDADLIIVGTHGRKGIARTIFGSVAEEVIRTSNVPVLVVTRHAKPPPLDRLFARALVAVDEGQPSKAALSVAARLATGLGTHITLCTVAGSRRRRAQSLSADLTAAASLLSCAAEVAAIAPFLDDEIMVDGEPVGAIEHAAMQRNCDLVVVDSHGARGLLRAFERGVAETVARSSAVPVLVTPAGKRAAPVTLRGEYVYEGAKV